jgi:TRAP-type mannitol/chloroaromatic compound transport system permease large subunit
VAPAAVDVGTIYRGVVPFILLQLLGLAVAFFWTDLMTRLPGVAYGS